MKYFNYKHIAKRACIHFLSKALPFLLIYVLLTVLIEFHFYLNSTLRFIILFSWLFLFLIVLLCILLLNFSNKFLYEYIKLFKPRIIFENKKDTFNFLNYFQLSKLRIFISNNSFNKIRHRLIQNLHLAKLNNIFKLKEIKIVTILLICCFAFILFSFSTFKESYNRIIHYNEYFSEPDLLEYYLTPDNLSCFSGDDFVINLMITGNLIPDKIKILKNGKFDFLTKINNKNFSYKFHNLNQNTEFAIVCENLNHFKKYYIDVKPKSYFDNLNIIIIPPAYIQSENDTITDLRDISVPEGSNINILFSAYNYDSILYRTSFVKSLKKVNINKNEVINRNIIFNSEVLMFYFYNNNMVVDSIGLPINVIKDKTPSISCEILSKINYNATFFLNISDDYKIRNIGYELGQFNSSNFQIIESKKLLSNYQGQHYKNEILLDFSKYSAIDSLGIRFFTDDYYPYKDDHITYSNIFLLNTKITIDSIIKTYKYAANQSNSLENSIHNLNDIELNLKLSSEISKSEDYLVRQISQDIKSAYSNFEEAFNNLLQEIKKEEMVRNDLESLKLLSDSLYNDIINKLDSRSYNPHELTKQIKDLTELMDIIKHKLQTGTNDTFVNNFFEAIDRMINEQITKNNVLNEKITRSNNSLDSIMNKFDESINELKTGHKNITNQYNKFFKESGLADNNEAYNDSLLNTIDKQYDSLNKIDKHKSTQTLQNINNNYKSLSDNLFNSDFDLSSSYLDINKLKSYIKSLIQLSKQIEYSSKYASYRSSFTKDSILYNFMNFSANWSILYDSLYQLFIKSDFPVSSLVNSSLAINKSLKSAEKSYKANNFINFSKETNHIMSQINLINLNLSEILNSIDENQMNSNMQSAGMCKIPKKGGGNKPQQSTSLSEIMKLQKELSDKINQKMNGKKNGSGIDNKELNEYFNLQFEIREKLSELLQNAEMKNYAKVLDQVAEEMRKNEAKLLDKYLNKHDLIEQQKRIEIRLLEADKAIRQQEFENKRISRDAGNYMREWDKTFDEPHFNSGKEKSADVLKLKEVSLRMFYQDLYMNYQTNGRYEK